MHIFKVSLLASFFKANAAGVQLQFEKQKDGDIGHAWSLYYIHADRHKFAQVMNNLITNAFKFTPSGGVVTVELMHRQGQGHHEGWRNLGSNFGHHFHSVTSLTSLNSEHRAGVENEGTRTRGKVHPLDLHDKELGNKEYVRDGLLLIRVTDTGVGIAEVRSKLN